MKRATCLLVPGLLLVAAGCTTDGGMRSESSTLPNGPGATATLADATGAAKGTARFVPEGGGVKLTVDASGLPAGVHGIHVHAVGKCDAPDFTTAGPHWNPTMKMHGTEAPNGPHRGDLPNMTIAADGTGHFETVLAGAMLSGGDAPLLDADGAALVIHATADDYKTDPSGNSGGRIACGVIVAG